MPGTSCFGNHREPALVWSGPEGMVVVKPAGMHSAPGPLPDGSSLAEWVFKQYPEAARVEGRGKGEGGLLHRLDRDTEGLVLFALTDGFFTAITEGAALGEFQKSYLARVLPGCGGLDGSRPLLATPVGTNEPAWKDALRRQDLDRLATMLSGSTIESRFRAYGPGSRRVACSFPGEPSSKKDWTQDVYLTKVETARATENGFLVDVRLSRGFRHQVRAHLAWVGLSLEGDPQYGEGEDSHDTCSPGTGLKLLAYALSFNDPVSRHAVRITLPGLSSLDSASGAC